MKKQILAALATYGRTAASAVLGAYIAGQTNPKLLGSLALSSVAAPLFRALNPNDSSYGTKKSA
jgi:hypothetical protein